MLMQANGLNCFAGTKKRQEVIKSERYVERKRSLTKNVKKPNKLCEGCRIVDLPRLSVGRTKKGPKRALF